MIDYKMIRFNVVIGLPPVKHVVKKRCLFSQ